MLTTTRLALVAAAAIFMAACGGSDSSSPPPVSGIQPGTMSTVVGTISGFGSVIVDGVKFDDSRAAVTMDGAVAAQERLRLGMVVQIRGRIRGDGTGTADSIRYEDCVEGPITAMNQVQNTLTVLGQTVHVDDGTVFDGVTLRDMNSIVPTQLMPLSASAATLSGAVVKTAHSSVPIVWNSYRPGRMLIGR